MVGKAAYMELTQGQLGLINSLLPSRYILEIDAEKESVVTRLKDKHPEGRKVAEPVFQSPVPEKRPMRERKTVAYEEIDSSFKSSDGFKKLFKILQALKRHPMIDPFLSMVSPHEYPEYYKKIEKPIDLMKIEKKLKTGEYESGYEFAMDMRLLWNNSFLYNEKTSEIYENTIELCSTFENLMRGSEFLTLGDKKNLIQDLYRKIDKLSKGFKEIQNKGPALKVQVKTDKPMSFLEKKTLCESIKNLDPKFLKGVLDIVKECMDIQGEELEFDIDRLPPKVCRELDVYVKNCLQTPMIKKKPSVEPVKTVSEASSTKLKELDSQLEQLVQQKKQENPQTVENEEESDSESSSSSESEENLEEDKDEIWSKYQKIEEGSDHSNGFGSVMDFDKIY